jgi:hypothetical protein
VRTILKLALLGAGAYLVWQYFYGKSQTGVPALETKKPLPPGAKTTGKVAFSQTGKPPSQEGEVLGYDPKIFAEVVTSEGDRSWQEMERMS